VTELLTFFAIAGGSSGQNGGGGGGLMVFLPFILIIVVMYFLMIRPQSKRQKEHRAMLAALQKGDKIMTTGGIVGTIASIKEGENTLILKISENTKIELSRNAVGSVLQKK
jgi:preprotein translocase subunit YajC